MREKILWPAFHIMLGLAKQIIESERKAFCHEQAMFLKLLKAKEKVGIITRPQIQRILGFEELEGKKTAYKMLGSEFAMLCTAF